MIIDTIRPIGVVNAGGATAVPSGTLATVTADNSDATYAQYTSPGAQWQVEVASHTPPFGHQRHQIRARARARTNAGTGRERISLGTPLDPLARYVWAPITTTITEITTGWLQGPLWSLDTVGPLSGLNTGGGLLTLPTGGATQIRTMECYVDIDCRAWPDFIPTVLDAAGEDQDGGTITDTSQPTLVFGPVAYDGLPPRSWEVLVRQGGTVVYQLSGVGTPPDRVTVQDLLPDGSYSAFFTVTSTIRGSDEFGIVQSVSFEIDNEIPPPSPPLLTVEREGDGYRVTWEDSGGQIWDDDYVVTEVWRDDCNGSWRIAVIPDGLNGSYLDLAVPQIDTEHLLTDGTCTLVEHGCELTYRVRYRGYVSTTVTIPDSIPVDLVLGWPGTAASIPSGWLRVTELDGFYPRGATTTGVPSVTGGAASHSHTTPNHYHRTDPHRHTLANDTAGSATSTQTERKEKADISVANQSHDHSMPNVTSEAAAFNSSSTAAGTSTVANAPATREVIWIRSDGSATTYPIGVLGWSAQSVSGWTADVASSGRFLRGAAAGGNGGASYGSNAHTHTVNMHGHTLPNHDHVGFGTGLSGPAASTEANAGGGSPRWVARHAHVVNIVAGSSGLMVQVGGGTTGEAFSEPPYRRLRVLRNTNGGAQTRIIGLYTDAIADLDPVLTWCNGANGTPDMRTWFARDIGLGSVNATAGASSHNHSIPSHTHGFTTEHKHELVVGPPTATTRGRDTSGTQGSVPTATHIHTAPDTGNATIYTNRGGGGTSGTSTTLPPYREVHFVRVEGTVAGGDLPVPEVRISEFASVIAPALLHTDGMDRIGSLTAVMPVTTDRSNAFPRLVVDEVPLTGGVHTVSTSVPGEDLTLAIAVEGKPAIDALEAILAEPLVYWAPLGGTPGWFMPGGWSVAGPAPDVKVVSVVMARQPWPATPDPEEFL